MYPNRANLEFEFLHDRENFSLCRVICGSNRMNVTDEIFLFLYMNNKKK